MPHIVSRAGQVVGLWRGISGQDGTSFLRDAGKPANAERELLAR